MKIFILYFKNIELFILLLIYNRKIYSQKKKKKNKTKNKSIIIK